MFTNSPGGRLLALLPDLVEIVDQFLLTCLDSSSSI